MKIFLTDQGNRFGTHLKELMKATDLPLPANLLGKTSSIEISGNIDLEQASMLIFDYRIFPSNIMTSLPQWRMEKRAMKVGDTILQQVIIPPVTFPSIKILFGVRVTAIIQEANRRGFCYQTLSGHVETGTSTFLLEKTEAGIRFSVQTFSLPGNWFTKLMAPVFSLPYQTYCTTQALHHVRNQLFKTTQ